jgi:hypothetical protein
MLGIKSGALLSLFPPLSSRLPSDFTAPLRREGLRPCRAPSKAARSRKFLRWRRRLRQGLSFLASRQIDDHLAELVRVAGAFGVLGCNQLAPDPLADRPN